ncbi:hypothetical protein [Spirosoma aerophilum]
MAICGAPSVVNFQIGWGTWLAIGLAAICFSSIATNYRGKGTRTALCIALSGLSFLGIGLFTPDSMGWYYVGAILLFSGSFYNGRGYRWLSKLV